MSNRFKDMDADIGVLEKAARAARIGKKVDTQSERQMIDALDTPALVRVGVIALALLVQRTGMDGVACVVAGSSATLSVREQDKAKLAQVMGYNGKGASKS